MPSFYYPMMHLWAILFSSAAADFLSPIPTVRNAPGASNADTIQAVRRELSVAKLQGREESLKGSAILGRSWDEAVLLSLCASLIKVGFLRY